MIMLLSGVWRGGCSLVPSAGSRHAARLPFSTHSLSATPARSDLDRYLTSGLTTHFARSASIPAPLCSYSQYLRNANKVLEETLLSEAYPAAARRADTMEPDSTLQARGDGLVLVVHACLSVTGVDYTVCSGLVVQTGGDGERMVVTCAHTLEEIECRHPSLLKQTFVVSSSVPHRSLPDALSPTILHVQSIPTSLPRADLLVLRLPTSTHPLRSLPVSPYPIYGDQDVLVHFFGSPDPPLPRLWRAEQGRELSTPGKAGEREQSPARPWPQGMGWKRWVRGRMLGYRGDLWEEAEPGTADSLTYILTSPLPSPGSSGGPIVDAQSGAVVGVISGTRMDNRIEGERGWGASAENIFELFSLPDFVPASKRKPT